MYPPFTFLDLVDRGLLLPLGDAELDVVAFEERVLVLFEGFDDGLFGGELDETVAHGGGEGGVGFVADV